MSEGGEQAQWVMESLPLCANVFKATATGRPSWVIVRFRVPPEEALPEDMTPTFWKEDTRTKALILSKSVAITEYKEAVEKQHRGVWHMEKNGEVFWQTVWPSGF